MIVISADPQNILNLPIHYAMGRVIPLIVAVAVLLQVFSQTVIVIDFSIQHQYITEKLCENRDKPKMNCNGKCHLKKAFNADANRSRETGEVMKVKFESPVYCSEKSGSVFQLPVLTKVVACIVPELHTGNLLAVFHPPKMA